MPSTRGGLPRLEERHHRLRDAARGGRVLPGDEALRDDDLLLPVRRAFEASAALDETRLEQERNDTRSNDAPVDARPARERTNVSLTFGDGVLVLGPIHDCDESDGDDSEDAELCERSSPHHERGEPRAETGCDRPP